MLQRLLVLASVVRAAQHLAIGCHNLPCGQPVHRLYPLHKTSPKLLGVQCCKHAPEDMVGWYPVRQLQKPF
jgi:hypothetical protein